MYLYVYVYTYTYSQQSNFAQHPLGVTDILKCVLDLPVRVRDNSMIADMSSWHLEKIVYIRVRGFTGEGDGWFRPQHAG